jgi:preprotein translocase subunit SecY
MDIIPYFKNLKEQGEEGRRKINKINRYGGIIIAFVQGYLFSIMFIGDAGTPMTYLRVALILTAGTAFLLWLGDQITSKGIGNGISMIIMAGIVNTIPAMLGTAFSTFVSADGTGSLFVGIITYVLFILVYLGIIVGIIFVEQAERRLPIQYSNRTSGSYGGRQTYLPMKINTAGVIPVIFASTLISIPTTITYFVDSEKVSLFIQNYLSYTTVTGFILYMVLIFLFAYFYVFIAMNPEDVSKNLNKSGGYIPGIRPGKETSAYIKKVLSRITLLGATFLAILSAIPILFSVFTSLTSTVTIGGTSLLIVVGVLLDTYKQLESSVASRGYKKGRS